MFPFLIIDFLILLIPEVVAEVFNPISELVIVIVTPSKEAKAIENASGNSRS